MSAGTVRRDALRKLARSIRAIPGRDFGLRPYTVKVVTISWTGANPGEGTESTTETAITEADGQPPKVRFLNDEQIALGGHPAGTIEVGPITAAESATWAVLSGSGTPAGDGFYYVLTGPEFPDGTRFLFLGGNSDRALHYRVRLKPYGKE